jgi:hypothetical protein
MQSFRAIGDWDEKAVRVSWTASTRVSDPRVEGLIDAAWAGASQRKGIQLFDGPMCRLESFTATPSKLELKVSRTSYRTFLGTNMTLGMVAAFSASRANPIGLSTSMQSSDGYVLLGRRTETVAYYPGRIHPFAGAAEPADPLNLFDEVRRELDEELAFRPDDIADLRCVAMVEDGSLAQPELVFHCRSTRPRDEIVAQLDQTEHRSAWSAPADPDALAVALKHPAPFTPVAIATLLLFGRSAFGEKWFNDHEWRFTGK